MSNIDLTQPKGAVFTEDNKHRLALWRVWSPNKPLLLFIGLNPSRAGQISDDPTITRLIKRAAHEGFGGLLAGNLFTLISPEPGILLKDPTPIIPEITDRYLIEMIELSTIQLCAWGSFSPVKLRAPVVYKMLTYPCCLGINSDGEPIHPLYVSYSIRMFKYERSNFILD